jgi:hypothetical protein
VAVLDRKELLDAVLAHGDRREQTNRSSSPSRTETWTPSTNRHA